MFKSRQSSDCRNISKISTSVDSLLFGPFCPYMCYSFLCWYYSWIANHDSVIKCWSGKLFGSFVNCSWWVLLVVGTYSESETGMAQPPSTTTRKFRIGLLLWTWESGRKQWWAGALACYFGPESQEIVMGWYLVQAYELRMSWAIQNQIVVNIWCLHSYDFLFSHAKNDTSFNFLAVGLEICSHDYTWS